MDNYDNWLIKCYTKKKPEGGQGLKEVYTYQLTISLYALIFQMKDKGNLNKLSFKNKRF